MSHFFIESYSILWIPSLSMPTKAGLNNASPASYRSRPVVVTLVPCLCKINVKKKVLFCTSNFLANPWRLIIHPTDYNTKIGLLHTLIKMRIRVSDSNSSLSDLYIEVYKSDKLEIESEALANYAPPNNSSPSTFKMRIMLQDSMFYLYIHIICLYIGINIRKMKATPFVAAAPLFY